MTTATFNGQLNASNARQAQRGIASLTWGGHVLRFRTNPNECTWNYSLITHTDQTYGGRVVQILGTKIDDLTVKVDCGNGGWNYLMSVVTFMRDLMVAQRNGQPATFEYTTRNWKLNVYAAGIPFQDQVTATTRELTLNFKVQQDVTGSMSSATISAFLQTLSAGIGWTANQYNNVGYQEYNSDTGLIPNVSTFAGGAARLAGSASVTPVDLGGLLPVPAASVATNNTDTTQTAFYAGPGQ